MRMMKYDTLFVSNNELDFDDVSIKPKPSSISSRKDVDINVMYGKNTYAKPIIVAPMTTVGTIKAAKYLYKHGIPVALHKYHNTKELKAFFNTEESKLSFITFGMIEDLSSSSLHELLNQRPYLILDVAHGGMDKFVNQVKSIRQLYPSLFIMAGNVCESESARRLFDAGADVVKCGLSQGNACTTKNKSGVGRKPISTILECADVARSYNKKICYDGGIREVGDICKCLAAGASYVMSGYLFAPYKDISDGQIKIESHIEVSSGFFRQENIEYIEYYGMSSKRANDLYCGGLKEYRASEGKELWLPIKQNPEVLIQDICGGIASCCSYLGVDNPDKIFNK